METRREHKKKIEKLLGRKGVIADIRLEKAYGYNNRGKAIFLCTLQVQRKIK